MAAPSALNVPNLDEEKAPIRIMEVAGSSGNYRAAVEIDYSLEFGITSLTAFVTSNVQQLKDVENDVATTLAKVFEAAANHLEADGVKLDT